MHCTTNITQTTRTNTIDAKDISNNNIGNATVGSSIPSQAGNTTSYMANGVVTTTVRSRNSSVYSVGIARSVTVRSSP